MKYSIVLVVAAMMFNSCQNKRNKESKTDLKSEHALVSGSIKSYDYSSLAPLLNRKDDKTYVVNFWATWCKPCVEELPAFEKLNKNYKDKNVEVLLVSLDFPDEVTGKLLPFLKEHKIASHVVLFDDPNQDVWISKINEDWSGALPATLIYNASERKFFEKPFTYKNLENELHQFFNK